MQRKWFMRQTFRIYLFFTPLVALYNTPAFASSNQITHQAANPHDINLTYRFLICINTLFFVGIVTAMSVFMIKNRKTGLDMIWSMIPAIMLILIVGLGWANFREHHLGETFYAFNFSQ